MIWKRRTLGLMVIMVVASGVLARADQTVLRSADSLPTGHYLSKALIEPFMATVEDRSNGELKFEYYPGEQLGKAKDMLALTQTGVTDVSYIGPAYVTDKMPLSAIAELPENFATACEGTRAIWELAKAGGALDKAEYEPNNVRVLMLLMLPPYQIFSREEITNLSSLKGQKVRSSGNLKEITLTKLGVVPIQMAAPEARDALSRGTVDGVTFNYSSILAYDLAPHLKSATDLSALGSGLITYMISLEKFNSLPSEMQELLSSVGEEITFEGCKTVDEGSTADRRKLEETGVDFVALSPEEAQEIAKIVAEVGDEWAERMDGYGLPASEVLTAYREALDSLH